MQHQTFAYVWHIKYWCIKMLERVKHWAGRNISHRKLRSIPHHMPVNIEKIHHPRRKINYCKALFFIQFASQFRDFIMHKIHCISILRIFQLNALTVWSIVAALFRVHVQTELRHLHTLLLIRVQQDGGIFFKEIRRFLRILHITSRKLNLRW